MANQVQLADNSNDYAANHRGISRKGCALLQGIVLCGCCGRHVQLRYSGPHGEYPVYSCSGDHDQACSRCQEVRALQVEAEIERLLWVALAPDQLAVAAAALEQLEEEARLLERQWALKRERARYEAERARRQYVAVEPENRLVARNLECAWEDKLRQQEKVEQDYERWRREQPVALTEADRQEILTITEDLPRVWRAPTTTAADRKQLVRFILKEVALHQKREAGLLWMRISWQTGAITEHWMRRRVQDYRQYANLDRLEQRLRELNAKQKMDAEIAAILNAEGIRSAQGRLFKGPNIHRLRKRWHIPTVKINGTYQENPPQWPDGSYSVQGAATALGISIVTVFTWLRKGRFRAEQLAHGMPWKIWLSNDEINTFKGKLRHISRSRVEAS